MTGRHLAWILALLLALAVAGQWLEARDCWRAGRILRAVESATSQASQRGSLPRRLGDAHLRLLREAEALHPALVDAPVARGWQYLLLGRPQGAVRAFEEALALEPQSGVYANLGQAHWSAGDRDEARDAFEKAVVLDPNIRQQIGDRLP